MKPLIIGQAPARGNDDHPAFYGASGARLARLAGVGNRGQDLYPVFDTINLMVGWPGKQGKGDKFDMAEAVRKGQMVINLLTSMERRTHVLMMGRKVRRAMRVNGTWEYLEEFEFWGHTAVIFPHPSGVNRWWNDRENELAAAKYLRGLVRERQEQR